MNIYSRFWWFSSKQEYNYSSVLWHINAWELHNYNGILSPAVLLHNQLAKEKFKQLKKKNHNWCSFQIDQCTQLHQLIGFWIELARSPPPFLSLRRNKDHIRFPKENANMIQAIKQHEQLNKNTDHNKTFEKQKNWINSDLC